MPIRRRLRDALGLLLSMLLVALFAWAIVLRGREAALSLETVRSLNLAAFDRAWTLARETNFDPDLGGVDWEAARDELRPRMARTRSRVEGRAVLRDLLARAGQSHFAVLPAEALNAETFQRESGVTGIDLRILGGRAVVSHVEPGSAASRAGVHRGWVVLRIDGVEIGPLLERLADELPEGTRRRLALTDEVRRKLAGPIGSSRRVAFLDASDQPVELVLTLETPPGRLSQVGSLPASYTSIEVKELPGDVGYIAFQAFDFPAYVMDAYNRGVESFFDARGLVIDLRGNSGGLMEMVLGTLGWLTDERLEIGREVSRDGESKVLVQPRLWSYSGPVAVLIDELCISGAELFAHAAGQLPNARRFGTRTGGAVLGAMVEPLPNGDALMFPVTDLRATNGQRLENVGVEPDVIVEVTRDQLLHGLDPVLDAALDWIETRPGPSPPARRRDVATAPEPPPRVPKRASVDARAAEVLDRFVAVTGGREAYASISSRVVRSNLDLPAGIRVETITYIARPHESLTIESSDYLGESRHGVFRGLAWETSLFSGPRRLDAARRRLLLSSSSLDAPSLWREAWDDVEYLGREPVGGESCHHLRLVGRAGREEHWYSSETGLLLKTSAQLSLPVGEVPIEVFPSDYRWVDGILLAHHARFVSRASERVVQVVGIEHDVELDESLFLPPPELLETRNR